MFEQTFKETMIEKLNRKRIKSTEEEGFSLVEIVIIVIVLGILLGFAVPFFANQQRDAVRAGMKTDVRRTVTEITTMMATGHPQAFQSRSSATGLFFDVRDKIMNGKLQSNADSEIGIVTSVSYAFPPEVYTVVQGDISWKQYAVIIKNEKAKAFYGYDSAYGTISVIYEQG